MMIACVILKFAHHIFFIDVSHHAYTALYPALTYFIVLNLYFILFYFFGFLQIFCLIFVKYFVFFVIIIVLLLGKYQVACCILCHFCFNKIYSLEKNN